MYFHFLMVTNNYACFGGMVLSFVKKLTKTIWYILRIFESMLSGKYILCSDCLLKILLLQRPQKDRSFFFFFNYETIVCQTYCKTAIYVSEGKPGTSLFSDTLRTDSMYICWTLRVMDCLPDPTMHQIARLYFCLRKSKRISFSRRSLSI